MVAFKSFLQDSWQKLQLEDVKQPMLRQLSVKSCALFLDLDFKAFLTAPLLRNLEIDCKRLRFGPLALNKRKHTVSWAALSKQNLRIQFRCSERVEHREESILRNMGFSLSKCDPSESRFKAVLHEGMPLDMENELGCWPNVHLRQPLGQPSLPVKFDLSSESVRQWPEDYTYHCSPKNLIANASG